jgi:catechol 2,3-dioxygenase-like lactoylglutathione lyase family enzyme
VSTAFRDAFPIVYVTDVDRSAEFYIAAFGFEVGFRWPDEGPAEFVQLSLGEQALGLSAAAGEPLHGLPMTADGPTRFELCIYTDDTDKAAERLRELGARELKAPEDMPWRERLCYFADPDGNPLHITAPLD